MKNIIKLENKTYIKWYQFQFVNLKNKELNEGFGENYISKDGKKINFFNKGFKNNWQNDLPKDIINKINKNFEKELIELDYI